jgi:hypothetical protein
MAASPKPFEPLAAQLALAGLATECGVLVLPPAGSAARALGQTSRGLASGPLCEVCASFGRVGDGHASVELLGDRFGLPVAVGARNARQSAVGRALEVPFEEALVDAMCETLPIATSKERRGVAPTPGTCKRKKR